MNKAAPLPFLERTLASLNDSLEQVSAAERLMERPGIAQSLDPRVKVVGVLVSVLVGISTRHLAITASTLLLAITLFLVSGLSLRFLITRIWLGVLLFTGCIALPAVFTTPGHIWLRIDQVSVSREGLITAAQLLTRATTSATWMALLVMSTPWPHVLKALSTLRIPATAIAILGMTHRYIFLLIQMARDQMTARRCRIVSHIGVKQRQKISGGSAAVLLEKSLQMSGEVFSAMQSRGFRGGMRTIDEFRTAPRDWVAAGLVGLLALGLLLLDREWQ